MDRTFQKRRRGPDLLVKSIHYFASFSWFIILLLFIAVSVAKPRMETFFDRFAGGRLSNTWDQTFMGYAFWLLIFLFIICSLGLIINSSRHKRKSDHYNLSLIIFEIMSVLGIILYVVSYV
jgi:hypothetical protein